MATYKQIQEYIKDKKGYTVKSCWIAHMKEICGLKVRMSPNRKSPNSRVAPCPINKQEDIKKAFEYFGMM